MSRIKSIYALGQRHSLAALNLAFGLFNISNAIDDPVVFPAWVCALVGAINLVMAGWSFGVKRTLDEFEDDAKFLLSVTHDLARRVQEQNQHIRALLDELPVGAVPPPAKPHWSDENVH